MSHDPDLLNSSADDMIAMLVDVLRKHQSTDPAAKRGLKELTDKTLRIVERDYWGWNGESK